MLPSRTSAEPPGRPPVEPPCSRATQQPSRRAALAAEPPSRPTAEPPEQPCPGRAIDFEVWVDDLQLFLQCDRADGLSLFDLTSGASPAPAADADATVCSQWATRDAAARLAVRRHLRTSERALFSQYKSAQTFRSVRRLPLAGDAALARARGARELEERAVEVEVEAVGVVGVAVGVEVGVGGSVAAVEAEAAAAVAVGAEVAEEAAVEAAAEAAAVAEAAEAAAVAEAAEAVGVAVELVAGLRRGVAPVVARASSSSAVVRPCPLSSSVSGTLHASGVGVLVRAPTSCAPATVRGELSRAGVVIFDLDFDAILSVMYAVSNSDEGDCYRCFPPDPGIEAAALGACDAAALGASVSASSGTSESALSGTTSASASLTFTLDSGASRSFSRDRTTLTPLSRPVAMSLADPSGGPVLSRFSTVLPCPAAPSGTLSGLYLPSFSTNLVSGADLQDAGVHQFTPARHRGTHCTEASTGRHLATFTRQPGSSLYTLTTASPPVAESGRVAASGQVFAATSWSGPESAPCSCRLLSYETLLWHHRLGHPSLLRLRGIASHLLVSGLPRSLPPLPQGPGPACVPCVEGRQRAAPHSSQFPSTEAPLQTLHMDVWGPARVCRQSHERYFPLVVDDYSRYTTVFPLRTKGGVTETFTLPDSPQQNGIAERRIGMVMDVARTSMKHAAAPHFLWPFVMSAFVRDLSADKLSPRAAPCVFLGFPPDAPGWQFYHPTSRRVLSSQDVTFDESVPYYRLFPYRTPSLPPPPLFLIPGPPQVDPLPPQGLAPSGVSHVDAVEPVEVTLDSGAAGGDEPGGAGPRGTESGGAEPRRAASWGAEPGGAELGGAASGGAETGGAEPRGAASWGAEPGGATPGGAERGGAPPGGSPGASSRREPLSPQELREWFARRWRRSAGAGGSSAAEGAAVAGPGGARTESTGAAGPAGSTRAGAAEGIGAETTTGGPARGAPGAAGGSRAAGGSVGAVAPAEVTGAVPAVSGVAMRPRPYFSQLQAASLLPAPSPYAGFTGGLTERREPASRPASPVRAARASGRGPRQRPLPVPGMQRMSLRSSTAPLRAPLPSPPESSLPALADPASDSLRAATPAITRLFATVVTDASFESTAASAIVAELVDLAAHCRLDYAASLVAESESVCPPSVGGECAPGTDVLEDRQEEFQCLAAASPHLVSVVLTPEGDPDALDIPTPRSYTEAIEGPYSSQWQAAMDAEMASWKSTGTYVDGVRPPGANIVSGMWSFRVKRPPVSPPVFEARYVARGFSQRQGVYYFQTFSPTPKMTTLRVLLHVAAHRDYELHSLDFSTAFLQGSLHEEIWLRRPAGFTGSFPLGTKWSLRRPVYGLHQAPREWHDTLRTTLTPLGFAPSTADPSLFLRTDTSLPPFYILVYVDDLVFATADTAGLAYVKSELQKRHTCTDLGELRSYLGLQIARDRARRTITLTHILACYVAPGRHRPEDMAAAKRVLHYLCSTSGMGLVLGGRSPVVLTEHADASWADDQATQRSSQGYTFSLGFGSVSWRATRSSSVLGSNCEAEIYAGAMAAQEFCWLTYLLTGLGEPPCSPPVLYVDNKAMLALCREQRLEHRTKHIALRYFLACELQQRGQLRLAYVASEANTADVFINALAHCDHQRFCTQLGLVPVLPHLLSS
ncbi:unnamed protein product [Closterium sp. NIES-65]|nr:unnamed protein product [Closterium sp. NIES-65]